jgi:hypothetical protein
MNKKDFMAYMEKEMSGLTDKQKVALLRKMEGNWLPSLLKKYQKKLGDYVEPKERDKYVLCDACKKYYSKTKVQSCYVHETRTETIYVDAGYGDNDMIGDVRYFVEYKICPRCGNKQEIGKMYIETKNERRARDK